MACEVGGRWSEEAQDFVRSFAQGQGQRRATALEGPSLLACSAARAFALSLLERRGGLGADGATPSFSEVITEGRYVGLSVERPVHPRRCFLHFVQTSLSHSPNKSKIGRRDCEEGWQEALVHMARQALEGYSLAPGQKPLSTR